MKQIETLVIGSGIAGLTAAALLGEHGSLMVATKGQLKQSNTYWAQGGMAAVMQKEDSFENHIQDTLNTGCGFSDPAAVRFLVEHAPAAVRWLEDIGVKFQSEPALEGGHSHARVWRTSDFTGQDLMNGLIKKVKKMKSVKVLEDTEAVRLIVHQGRCVGAFLRQGEAAPEAFFARQVILATGGLGQLYFRTTNTLGSGGDGLALALQAELALQDIEFIQFHPTALDKPDEGRYFLLSEALRGFGAKVVNAVGNPFLQRFDQRAELAPRDLVSRAIYFEQQSGPVYLDMRHLDSKTLKKQFPHITKALKGYGFDIAKDLIPITPVAHYSCGGVPVDLKSATALPGLYAVGEVARTGVHGANRLASNSLTEAVVFAQSLAQHLIQNPGVLPEGLEALAATLEPPACPVEELTQVKAYARRLGQIMWDNAGIVRTREGLEKGLIEVESLPARDYRIQARQQVCRAIIQACLNRFESAGTHYMMPELPA